MSTLSQLTSLTWTALAEKPVLETGATVFAFLAATRISRLGGNHPLLNPTLLAIILISLGLEASHIPYDVYLRGADAIHFMLGPAVVLLAVPLFRQRAVIRASARLIAVGLAVGLPVGVLSAVGLAWVLGASSQTILSLAPKSVTAGIAVGISEQIGGLQTLTIVLVVMTGITGAVLGPIVARLARIDDPRIVGLAMGIASHGIGTARALQINEVAGAFSGLGMGLKGGAHRYLASTNLRVVLISINQRILMPSRTPRHREAFMFKQFLFVAAIASLTLASPSRAYCRDALEPGVAAAESPSVQFRPDATRSAEDLLHEIVRWLASNFDLPAIEDHPNIKFASKTKLATIQADDRAHWQGLTQDEGTDQLAQHRIVALYDNKSRTIFLPDDWIGKSPADQSVLVHEMVHHLQNLANMKFECPMAREKLAYLAQDKWLGRFGTSLEKEFDVDMFTVLISSACMY